MNGGAHATARVESMRQNTLTHKNTNRHVAAIHNTSGQLLRIHVMRIHSVRFMDLFCSLFHSPGAQRCAWPLSSHNVIQHERPSTDTTGQHIHKYIPYNIVCVRIHHECVCVVTQVARKSRSEMEPKRGRYSKRPIPHVHLYRHSENTH